MKSNKSVSENKYDEFDKLVVTVEGLRSKQRFKMLLGILRIAKVTNKNHYFDEILKSIHEVSHGTSRKTKQIIF